MDIRSFFRASTSSSVASSSTIWKKESNCSDSDSDIAEPPSKKACRVLIQFSTTKRKHSGKKSSASYMMKTSMVQLQSL